MTPETQKSFSEVASVEEVFRSYNTLAQLYSNPSNTLETNSALKLEINRIQVLIESIHNRLKNVIQLILSNASGRPIKDPNAQRIIIAYNLYDIIYD